MLLSLLSSIVAFSQLVWLVSSWIINIIVYGLGLIGLLSLIYFSITEIGCLFSKLN